MPDTYFKSVGPKISGFCFLFPDNSKIVSDNLTPINDLANLESGTEGIYNVLSPEFFSLKKRKLEKK